MERLKRREREHFGSRIDFGGDMYQDHIDFLEYANAYDNGDLGMRSKAKHDKWEKLLRCKNITLDGNDSLEYNLELVKRFI